MVVHLLVPSTQRTRSGPAEEPRVGFVVSKAVGPAVTRNLVKRRLRHLARERVASLPADGMLVVRALALRRQPTPKAAIKFFAWSNVYLMLVFVAVAVDTLVH